MKQAIVLAFLLSVSAKKSAAELELDGVGMGEFLTEPIMEAVGDLTSPTNSLFSSLVQLDESLDSEEQGVVLSIDPKSHYFQTKSKDFKNAVQKSKPVALAQPVHKQLQQP